MNKKLNVKDLINIGLFTILIFIFTFIGGMIGFVPILMPIVPFITGLFAGPVSMLFSTKIKKPGMLFIEQMIIAIIFVVTGHGPWMLVTAVFGSIFGEIVLKKGGYSSTNHARLAFVVASLSGLGNWIPIFFAREKYIEQMLQMGYGQDYANKMMSVLPNWSLVPITIFGMLGVYIGCTIGISILKKHFVKAGMIKEV
ncbi:MULTISPECIES: MptD family putative ECF transporter S component [Clostridium]|uniref:Energy-coupling factor transport system substrate-specific component n=1 Tax=Clostridium cadaveris TaxID=1529 RepID=A0A1I2J2N9_9CLOT|nr:MptD family putative ECF transporter S component [Clostridium cadaveris]MDU4951535.1 MptD family putative ECF transporter S component [Clostridium sp.]MDM8311354.1 MptD family putative ECF transporter S component [Clostridium cadaveris]MDY4950506.1 MptD family putative ECF transporter S component [Clostridium cadaveris]NME63262.1 MptD family putative ECF transporter S component [Clostridium cadaveris]NWK10200.1 MptD family putative ECF transporter S component [Clostridium cadaveris]